MLRLHCLVLFTPLLAIGQGLDGVVVDPSGRGIGGALVIASGVGLDRSDTTKPDGSFHLKSAGGFVSVRHMAYVPVVVRAAELSAPARIQLAIAGEPVALPHRVQEIHQERKMQTLMLARLGLRRGRPIWLPSCCRR
jgi:hypothetical protein